MHKSGHQSKTPSISYAHPQVRDNMNTYVPILTIEEL
jgi:hypothetical protein